MVPQADFAAMIAGLEEQGISQAEIARRAGVSRATVWRLANGACKDHAFQTIARVETVVRSAQNISPVKHKTA